MKKIIFLLLVVVLFSCGGPKNIKAIAQNLPREEPVELYLSHTFRHWVQAQGSGLLGAAIAIKKQNQIYAVMTNIDPVPDFKQAVTDNIPKYDLGMKITTSSNQADISIPPITTAKDPAIDRDFRELKKRTGAQYVLEFRLEGFSIIQKQGLAGDYVLYIRVAGILHNLKTGMKEWQFFSTADAEFDGYSLGKIVADNGKAIEIYMKKTIKMAVRQALSDLKSK